MNLKALRTILLPTPIHRRASAMNVIRPLIKTGAGGENIIGAVRDYLFETWERTDATSPRSKSHQDPICSIKDLLEANRVEDAYELSYELVRDNNMSDTLFLSLAYTNHLLNYPEAAAKYASQASELHRLPGRGGQCELLESFSALLSQIDEETKNDRIIVNERFLNLYPSQQQLEQINAVDTFIMEGLIPAEPFITRKDTIATIGSCFTGNVSTFLRHNGFDVPILNKDYGGNLSTGSFSDEVFNTYLLRYLFELAYGETPIHGDDYDVVNQHNRKTVFSVSDIRETFARATVFIITLGLSEVWYNKKTGKVYKTAKSVGEYDSELHDFRLTSVQENFDNIDYVYNAIRQNNPSAQIIFTLSPVPLKATFRQIAAAPANSVSKAILRVALDQLSTEYNRDSRLHYFPSYELITDCLPNPFGPDRRYVNKKTVNFAMTLFARHYVVHEEAEAFKLAQP